VTEPFTFGVFPFGLAGGPDGLAAGPPDDLGQIRRLLRILQGDGAPLPVRAYVGWSGPDTTTRALAQVAGLLTAGFRWDLVLAYRDRQADIDRWAEFAARVVTGYGPDLASVQITGEANLTGIPEAGDGAYPGAVEALVHGVTAAAAAKQRAGLSLPVGFAVVPERDPAAGAFWPAVAAAGGPAFAASVDYAGLDMYPDVFGGRIELDQMDAAVGAMMGTFRNEALPIAGIGLATPIRICENGWPTGPGRSEQDQAEVLDTVLRAVHARRHELNISHWELFALRDADSRHGDPFHQFGVVRDDYTPKPAFERLRRTIAELREAPATAQLSA
jgi:hypothetical protein